MRPAHLPRSRGERETYNGSKHAPRRCKADAINTSDAIHQLAIASPGYVNRLKPTDRYPRLEAEGFMNYESIWKSTVVMQRFARLFLDIGANLLIRDCATRHREVAPSPEMLPQNCSAAAGIPARAPESSSLSATARFGSLAASVGTTERREHGRVPLSAEDLQLMLAAHAPYNVAHTKSDVPSEHRLPIFRNTDEGNRSTLTW